MFIRYNQLSKYFEYDASGGLGAGPWIKLEIDYSQIINAPSVTLPPNVALIDVTKTWTAAQAFAEGSLVGGGNGSFTFIGNSLGPNQKVWNIINVGGNFRIRALNDAQNAESGNIEINRAGAIIAPAIVINGDSYLIGGLYERNRVVRMGEWQDNPFNAADFIPATGTWTVDATAVVRNRYTLVGKTMTWSLYLSWFSGTNVLTGGPTTIYVKIPGGFQCPGNTILTGGFQNSNNTTTPFYFTPDGASHIGMTRIDGAAHVGPVGIVFTFTFEVK